MWVYLNQKWQDSEEARISLWDRGFLFGESVYESLRTYDGKPFAVDRHYHRLCYSAGVLGIPVPVSLDSLRTVIEEGVYRNNLPEANIRIQLSAGQGHYQMREEGLTPMIVIVFKPLEPKDPLIETNGVQVALSRIRRYVPVEHGAAVKLSGASDIIIARREIHPPFYDRLMLNHQGHVAEGTFSNVFFVKNQVVLTPSIHSGILSGITREIVIDFARELGVPVEERFIELIELFDADELFLTHTSAEIVPISAIQGIPKSIGPITQELMRGFRAYVINQQEGVDNHGYNSG
jgi:branched-chain amino acid aminotransferase